MTENSKEMIERYLAEGESETVEFKESLDEEAMESIAAFANGRGGSLLIGVSDDGAVKGVQLGKETLRDWANRIAQSTRLHPKIVEVSWHGKSVVLIEAAESPVKPIPCRGRFFKRVSKSNRQMTDDDFTRLVLHKVGSTWDEVAETRATLEDIDEQRVNRFRVLCNKKKRRLIPSEAATTDVLEKLGLFKDGRPTRAAVFLFGKEPQRFYPSATVKIGRFRPGNVIVDDREIEGTPFEQVDAVMDYFREHLQTRFEFHGEPAREVIWEYPLEALREAVTNAVCHRDYLDVSQAQVRWHDDRIVILNPGGLTPPLSLEALRHEHSSRPRNRKIAEMFYYAGLIEKWGGGTLQIIRSCRKADLPEPQFEEKQGGLWLTLLQDVMTEEYLRSLGLNERQLSGVLHAKKSGRLTNAQYQQMGKVSKRTASRELLELESDGLLEKVGTTGKGTYYRLISGKGAAKGPKGPQRGRKGAKS